MEVLRNILTTLLLCVSFSTAFAQETKTDNPERSWVTYNEEVITAEVPYKAGFFSSEKNVQIYGLLWTPKIKKGDKKKKLPLFVMNHGSQGSNSNNVLNTQADGAVLTLLEKGFAVLAPIRKGFRRRNDPSSEVNVDSSEAIDCGNYTVQEAGVKSGKDDIKAVLKELFHREDLDTNQIILAGQSRGGFLSLSLAAERLPGVIGVINLVGAWHSEPCPSGTSYNYGKFVGFGEKIKIPVFSYYGTNDTFYPEYEAKRFIELLSKNKKAVGILTPGYTHYSHVRDYEPWIEVATKLVKAD